MAKQRSLEDDRDVIWDQTLDNGTFRVQVLGTSNGTGHLVVTKEDDGTVLHEEDVALAYGAIFGPDVADVTAWQNITIRAVDEYLEKQ